MVPCLQCHYFSCLNHFQTTCVVCWSIFSFSARFGSCLSENAETVTPLSQQRSDTTARLSQHRQTQKHKKAATSNRGVETSKERMGHYEQDIGMTRDWQEEGRVFGDEEACQHSSKKRKATLATCELDQQQISGQQTFSLSFGNRVGKLFLCKS